MTIIWMGSASVVLRRVSLPAWSLGASPVQGLSNSVQKLPEGFRGVTSPWTQRLPRQGPAAACSANQGTVSQCSSQLRIPCQGPSACTSSSNPQEQPAHSNSQDILFSSSRVREQTSWAALGCLSQQLSAQPRPWQARTYPAHGVGAVAARRMYTPGLQGHTVQQQRELHLAPPFLVEDYVPVATTTYRQATLNCHQILYAQHASMHCCGWSVPGCRALAVSPRSFFAF